VPRAASDSPRERAGWVSLRRPAEFRRVLRRGRRIRTGGLTVVTAPGLEGVARVGFIADRRVGSATRRNRAKRRLRHALAEVPPPPGTDNVVIASPEVVTADYEEILEWLARAFGQRR